MDEQKQPTGPADLIGKLATEFDELCQTRHNVGQKAYGEFTFLEKDMFTMASEELADCVNYLRYMYIKLRLIEFVVDQELSQEEVPGLAGFFKLGGKTE